MQAGFLEEIPAELLEEVAMASDGQSTAEGKESVGDKNISQKETDTDTTACENDQVVKPTELSETEALGKQSQGEQSESIDLSDDLAIESSPVKNKKTQPEVKKPRPRIVSFTYRLRFSMWLTLTHNYSQLDSISAMVGECV